METNMTEKHIQYHQGRIHLTIDRFNKRVRAEDYLGNFQECVSGCLEEAGAISAEKVIFKARKEDCKELLAQGFVYEGKIDKFFLGSDCYFFAKYLADERRNSEHWVKEDEILSAVQELSMSFKLEAPPASYTCRAAKEEDSSRLANLYKKVFEVYPTPMNEADYVKKCMKSGTVFYIFEHGDEIVSAASAEINEFYHNAEITDCATLPDHRQYGLMKHLIAELEQHLVSREIYCIYSIARALSFGMNAALRQHGFSYQGRLANNCYIFDKLEDMNLWVKNHS